MEWLLKASSGIKLSVRHSAFINLQSEGDRHTGVTALTDRCEMEHAEGPVDISVSSYMV